MDDPYSKLTDMQKMVLRFQGCNLGDAAQATALNISEDSLRKHRAALHRIFESKDLSSYAKRARQENKENKEKK